MDIQVPGQERSHLKLKQTRNLRHNPAIEEEEDEDYDEVFGSTSVESSSEEDSRDSSSCSSGLSLSDVAEDCASSSSSPSSRSSSSMALSSNGPLYDLSRLMSQLPIKRGLSKFYEGKSQSFTSLANVESIKDLPKKGWYSGSHGMRMKSSKSFGGLFEQSNKRAYSPKATITKKSTRIASAMSSLSRRAALLEACRLSTPATGEEDILLLSQNPSLQPSCTQYIPM